MHSWEIAEQSCMSQISPTLECAQAEIEVQLVEDSRNQVSKFNLRYEVWYESAISSLNIEVSTHVFIAQFP
jgi:hypothetical protein